MEKWCKSQKESEIQFKKKTKYMVTNTGNEKQEDVSEQVRAGSIQRTEKHRYLEITINEEKYK